MPACRNIPPECRSRPPLPAAELEADARRIGASAAPRARRRRLDALLVTALLVLLLVPAALAPVCERQPAATTSAEVWPTDVHAEPVPVRPGSGPKPLPNQKQAPCTAGLEVELSGVCWLELAKKPPHCPPQTVAHDGKCLLGVATPRPVPTSVDGEGEPAR